MSRTKELFLDYAQASYPHLKIKQPKKRIHLSIQLNMRSLLYTLFCIATAMVGYTIHGSIFWSIVDFIFTPLAICKWLVCHELTLSVIKSTFDFLNH